MSKRVEQIAVESDLAVVSKSTTDSHVETETAVECFLGAQHNVWKSEVATKGLFTDVLS
jgi:hypothetical protein